MKNRGKMGSEFMFFIYMPKGHYDMYCQKLRMRSVQRMNERKYYVKPLLCRKKVHSETEGVFYVRAYTGCVRAEKKN